MQALHMLSVSEKYQPLAGSGQNTIRLGQNKYHNLLPGDNVVMTHTRDAKSQDLGDTHATEFLKVSSVAIGTLDQILAGHGRNNHGYADASTQAKLKSRLLGHYPGGTIPDDATWVAIYF